MDMDLERQVKEQKAKAQAEANRLGRNVEWCLGVCRPQSPDDDHQEAPVGGF